MALLFMDGFDHYAIANVGKKWEDTLTPSTTIVSGGRVGGQGYYWSSPVSNRYLGKITGNLTTYIVGFGVVPPNSATSNRTVFQALDSTTVQQSLGINPDGSVTISGQTSAAGVISFGAWNYIEIKCTTNNTTGSVEVRLNGSSSPVINATGIDTQATANAYCNRFRLYTGSGTDAATSFDDFYLCDTSGSVNNNFLGDVVVRALFPTGAGNYTQFTPSVGANYTCVDETQVNTTDYVTSSTVGNIDTYAMGDLPTGATGAIYAVQVNNLAYKDDAGARSVSNVVRSSTTDETSTAVALTTSQLDYRSIHETDPATSSAWTVSGVNAMEAGTKVAA